MRKCSEECPPLCDYGYGYCAAPDIICLHWQGTFCELDLSMVSWPLIIFPKLSRILLFVMKLNGMMLSREEFNNGL